MDQLSIAEQRAYRILGIHMPTPYEKARQRYIETGSDDALADMLAAVKEERDE